MKNNSFAITALAVLSAGGLVQAQNVATAISQPSGSAVTISSDPIVTAIMSQPYTFNGTSHTSYAILTQDSSGSAELYGSLPSSYIPALGDGVAVSGTFSPYHQIPEIGTLTALSQASSGNSLPAPAPQTIPALNVDTLPSTIAGYLIEVDNVTISGGPATFSTTGNTAYTITDGSGNAMTLYYWPTSYSVDAALAGTTVPTGTVDILALDSVYNNTSPELIPYSITPVPTPEPSSVALAAIGGLALLMGLRRGK